MHKPLPQEKVLRIPELRKQGKTYKQIASELGISKKSAYWYSNPEFRKKRVELRRNTQLGTGGRTFRGLHKRPRPDNCELCGLDRTHQGRLFYHHWDDNNLSLGMWLCYRCHIFVGALDLGLTATMYKELKERILGEEGQPEVGPKSKEN